MPKQLLFFLIGIGFLLISVSYFSQKISAQSFQRPDRVKGQILVKFKDTAPKGYISSELKKQGGMIMTEVPSLKTLVISVSDVAMDQVIAALSKNPYIEYVEPNYVAQALDFPSDAPSDTYYVSNQWGLENTGQVISGISGKGDADIDAQTAWQYSTGSASAGNVKVAVLDSGIDSSHPDLSAKVDLRKNFTDSSTTEDMYGHGTHVAGIIAAVTNNATGVAGVCPDCRLINGKVLNDTGSGAYSWIASGITWATDNGAKVINLSLGGSAKSTTLEKAVNYAWSKGVVIVAAAGNSGSPSRSYPGAYKNVISVAATNNLDKKAIFSSYGTWVTVAAPGENIFSTFPTYAYKINKSLNYDFASGTSMATPMTAGTVGLIWGSSFGTSNIMVRARLESTSDKILGTGNYWKYGRINAGRAVKP